MDCSHQFGGETFQCNFQIFVINLPNDAKEKSHILDQSANFEKPTFLNMKKIFFKSYGKKLQSLKSYQFIKISYKMS